MEFEYSLRPEDFRAFARYFRKLPSGKTTFSSLAVLAMVAIMLALGLALMRAAFFFEDKGVLAGMLIGVIWATLVQSWLQGCKQRSIYTLECEDPRSEWAVRGVRVVISPDQLCTVARGSTAMYEWTRIWYIGVTPKYVFLFVTRMRAILIPRRAFRDTAHYEEFIALAQQYQQARGQQEPKPTGIIAGLPPQSDAFRRSDVP